jgi:hypothetical protein
MLLSGYFPELVHKRGRLDKSLAFDDSRKQSLINKRSRDADVAADYSRRIRDGRGPAWNAREIGRNVVEELTYEPICKCWMTANR